MKKKVFLSLAFAAVALTSCGQSTSSSKTSGLGGILSSVLGSTSSNAGNIISSVLGLDKMTESSLHGTWKYSGAGCAFTSENALAKAGGEVAASTVKDQLTTQYKKLGFKSSNTQFTFNSDKTFTAKLGGKSFSGTYTFDSDNQAVKMKITLLSLTAYVKKTTSGMALLFESKKALTLFQTIAGISGNSTLSTIGDLSKNYDGVRIGFELKQ